MPAPSAILTPDEWRLLAQTHAQRADILTAGHIERRHAGQNHPVEDFLFTYYRYSPAKLRRWHPDGGVALVQDEHGNTPISGDKYTKQVVTDRGRADVMDVEKFLDARGRTLTFVATLLQNTLNKTPHLGCFGLHEWAMVYKLKPGEQRHEKLPLRLTQEQTDDVVERADIRCTHFDAYRFFTKDAVDLNTERPTRENQIEHEQPACLHANMDVYKWAFKLAPLISSDLILDAFEVAKKIRTLDMEASPYDVRDMGYGVVPIETPQGRATYVRRQKAFAEQTQTLRQRLLDELTRATDTTAAVMRGRQ